MEEELLGRLRVVELPIGARLEWVRDVARERVAGGRLYDAHIACAAELAGGR